MAKWSQTNGVTSSIPEDVKKLSPFPTGTGSIPNAFLLKDGNEEYNYFKNYTNKIFKVDAVMWVFVDGTEWEPN